MTPSARQTGATRGRRHVSHEALPTAPGFWENLKHQSRGQWVGWSAAGGAVVAVWLLWFVWTLPVRGELRRVEGYLATLPELRDVAVSKPWFSRTMPDTVQVTATGLPTGFMSEVRVELHGVYDTRTHVARFKGVKQVLFPYEKVELDWSRPVPAAN